MKTIFSRSILSCAILLAANTSYANVLDNSGSTVGSIAPFGQGASETYGEVFTAPITGTLTSFSLWLDGGVGSLYGGVGTWNGSSSYASGYGSPTNLYQSASVSSLSGGEYSFTPNISVVAGQQYVAYLSVFGDPNANSYTSMPTSGTSVSGIDYFVWNNFSAPQGNPSWNYFFDVGNVVFKADFAPAAVPVPAAAWLFGSGLIGLLGLKRRSQSAG